MYTPQLRPGIEATKLMDEDLILVASWENPTLDMDGGRYIFVDWGPEFTHFHNQNLPNLENTGLTLSLGALTADYIIDRKAAAYLPARFVQRNIDAGQLRPVPGAPHFVYPIWQVRRDDTDPILRAAGESTLNQIVKRIIAKREVIISSIT